MTIWQELKADYVNITSNQSTRNNFRTAERGIILIKTLIETRIALVKATTDQLNPYSHRMKKFILIYPHAYMTVISLFGLKLQNAL